MENLYSGSCEQRLVSDTIATKRGLSGPWMRTENESLVILNAAVQSGRLTRREMIERLLAGAGAAWPLVAASHPIYEHLVNGAVLEEPEKLGAADWKPLFLNVQQEETLAALAEAIVPGARKVWADRFIDLLLSVDTAEHRKSFLDSLAAFETESQKRFGKRFPALNSGEQNTLLTHASMQPAKQDSSIGASKKNRSMREHFENLKGWISGAYYSSEAGMRELGWTEDRVFEKFPGCDHPAEHH